MATITLDGRRVYVTTSYGEACIPALQNLGAHWDAESKRWWLTSAKKAKVEALLAAQAAAPKNAEKPTVSADAEVVGKATYKGRTYYVLWMGRCKSGADKARLTVLDGSIDFWVDMALISITKRYEPREERGSYGRPTGRSRQQTLGGIRRFIDKMKRDEAEVQAGTADMKQCWECGRMVSEMQCRSNGGDWNEGYCGC